jgi:hypothetical protein
MPLPRMQLHQREGTRCRQPRQDSTQGNEEGYEDVRMVLGDIAHDDQVKPKDDNYRGTWPGTVLGMPNGRMPSTLPVTKSTGTPFLSSTCSTHARRMESTIPTPDTDMEDN